MQPSEQADDTTGAEVHSRSHNEQLGVAKQSGGAAGGQPGVAAGDVPPGAQAAGSGARRPVAGDGASSLPEGNPHWRRRRAPQRRVDRFYP